MGFFSLVSRRIQGLRGELSPNGHDSLGIDRRRCHLETTDRLREVE
jgi:hypothetical protein